MLKKKEAAKKKSVDAKQNSHGRIVVIGASATLDAVIRFSDAMILAMVFPNMIGLLFLFPKVKTELNRYLEAIRSSGGKT